MMKELLNDLKKYIEVDKSVNDLYLLLMKNVEKQLSIYEIEDLINLLSSFLNKIKSLDQISIRRKNNILNILNQIIIYYNEHLMDEICKQI